VIRPVVCDWDAASTRPGTSENSLAWRGQLRDVTGIEEPIFLNRRLAELMPAILEAVVGSALAHGEQVIVLGGDHRLTYSVLKVLPHYTPSAFEVHQFDAHHDAHPAGSLSNFSFMHFVEHRLRRNVIRHGCREAGAPPPKRSQFGASYITVDVDYFDPAFFGCVTYPVPVPEGMKCNVETFQREIAEIAAGGPVLGCDIVEWQGDRATPEQSAVVHQVLTSLVGVMAERAKV
jgi:arginase family enzyme